MAAKNPKVRINLDLLRPQSNPERLLLKFLRWLFSSGRFIFIFVEALVLVVFILRFKFDADLADKKDAIDQRIVYIQSLKQYEIQIRETQAKLSTIANFRLNSPDYAQILQKIAGQTPSGVKILSLTLTGGVDKVTLSIAAQAQNNGDISSFSQGLTDAGFTDITLGNVGLEQGLLRFTLNASIQTQNVTGNSL